MDKAPDLKSEHRPLLIVIAGPNGSGKTSVTSQLLKSEWVEDAIYINPDIIAQEKFGDWNNKEAVINAAKYSEKLREKCLVEKKSFIFETVMSAKDKVDFLLRPHLIKFLWLRGRSLGAIFDLQAKEHSELCD